jgi:hypothetical protein
MASFQTARGINRFLEFAFLRQVMPSVKNVSGFERAWRPVLRLRLRLRFLLFSGFLVVTVVLGDEPRRIDITDPLPYRTMPIDYHGDQSDDRGARLIARIQYEHQFDRHSDAEERLARYALMEDEAVMPGPVRGSTGYAK